MSVAYPDTIEDDVKDALEAALSVVFEQVIPDPHERGELLVANSADVEDDGDGQYLVHVWWPHSVQKYQDATDAGDDYLDADGHADNPAMVVYDTLEEHGIPVPTSDPTVGVRLDRDADTVDIQFRVSAADFGGEQ
jgi:hypothetical protein